MVPHPFPCLPIRHSMRLDAERPGGFVKKRHQDGVTNFSFYHRTYTNTREWVSAAEQITGHPHEPNKAGPPLIQGWWEKIQSRGRWGIRSNEFMQLPIWMLLIYLTREFFIDCSFSVFSLVENNCNLFVWSHIQEFPHLSSYRLLLATPVLLFSLAPRVQQDSQLGCISHSMYNSTASLTFSCLILSCVSFPPDLCINPCAVSFCSLLGYCCC